MFISSLLFGISASLDALLVGISYGIRRVRIRLWQNLAISLVTLLGTCLSVGLGHYLAAALPSLVSEYAGSLVLILLGLYYIAKWMISLLHSLQKKAPATLDTDKNTTENPAPPTSQPATPCPGDTRICETPDCHKPVPPCLKPAEVLSLSLTLSINNLSAGFSASLAGFPLAPAAASTFACSVLFLSTGNRLGGSRWLQFAGCAAEPVSGLLLIALGIVPFLL